MRFVNTWKLDVCLVYSHNSYETSHYCMQCRCAVNIHFDFKTVIKTFETFL